MSAIKPLQWSEPAKPDGKICFYDNCHADTPFGRYQIEWKSWKEYDAFVVYGPEYCDGNTFIEACDDLDSAKAAAQRNAEKRVKAMLVEGGE